MNVLEFATGWMIADRQGLSSGDRAKVSAVTAVAGLPYGALVAVKLAESSSSDQASSDSASSSAPPPPGPVPPPPPPAPPPPPPPPPDDPRLDQIVDAANKVAGAATVIAGQVSEIGGRAATAAEAIRDNLKTLSDTGKLLLAKK